MGHSVLKRHPIRCRCGTVAGSVAVAHRSGRAICYCRDCQTYAQALGKAAEILDDDGGTDVMPTLQHAVEIAQGRDAIACVSLTERGLLRWYARCCDTPLGNTARDWRLSYVGLMHTCLNGSAAALDAAFGPATVRVNTQSAQHPVAATPFAALAFVARLAPRIVRARLSGSFRNSPFFDASGRPIVAVRVLSADELSQARSAVDRKGRS